MDIRPVNSTVPVVNTAGPVSEKSLLSKSEGLPGTASAPALVQQPASTSAAEEVDTALKKINEALQTQSPNLEFEIDESSDKAVVKVVDRLTNEVIRQMPSKEAIEISKAIDRMQGLLFKQQV
jgi:flagellar protein FlaG